MISEAQRLEMQWNGFWQSPDLGARVSANIKPFQPPEGLKYAWLGDLGNIPLGKRAEKFFLSGLSSGKDYEVIAKNIQLIEQGVTQGEIDFILRDCLRNSFVHVELAYKLYLYDPQAGDGLECWIGPNRRDRLVDKLAKLKEQQFPKLHHPAMAEILSESGIEVAQVKQALYLPGQLYLPYGSNSAIPALNAESVAGVYMGLSEFKSLASKVKCWIPDKQDWFIKPSLWPTYHSGAELVSAVEEKLTRSRSPMVWIKDRDNNFSRCFVVFWKT